MNNTRRAINKPNLILGTLSYFYPFDNRPWAVTLSRSDIGTSLMYAKPISQASQAPIRQDGAI